MARTVKAELEADVAGFVAPVEHATRATHDLDDKVEALDRDLNKIPADAAKAGAAMKLLGGDVDTLGKNLNSVGDKSTALNVLDARIRTARGEVRKLTDEFIKTGDADVFTRLGKSSGDLKALTDLRKKIVSELGGAGGESAKTFSQLWQGGLIDTFKALPSEAKVGLVASLVAVVAAAAPLLGATVNAALLAGVGGGGLAAGIALAVQDPRVAQAWSGLGTMVMGRLTEAASPFRAELVKTADIFGSAFHRIGPQLDAIFGKLAPYVSALASGVVGMVEKAMPGIERAVEAAGPILQAIADNLPLAGKALDKFFSSLAAGGPGAAAALKFVLVNVEALIVEFGLLFEYLSKAYEGFDKLSRKVAEAFGMDAAQPKVIARRLDDVKGSADGAGDSVKAAGDKAALSAKDFADFGHQLNGVVETADTLAGKITDKLLGSMLDMDHATLSFNESLTKVRESIKENGKGLDIHTAKGQANREAVLAAVEANLRIYDVMIRTGASAQEAAAAYDENTKALEAQLHKAGLTQAAIDGLIGKYKGVPDKVNTTIAIEGLTKAINDLAELIRQINGIHDKDFTITEHIRTVDSSGNVHRGQAFYERGGIRRAAEGLLVPPRDPGTVLFGEPQTGGEAFIPLRGIPQARAMGLAQTVGNSYGFDVVPRGGQAMAVFNLTVNAGLGTDGYRVGRQIADALREYVGPSGGNVQTAVMRRS